MRRRWRLRIDTRDLWVGAFVDTDYLYLCPLPCVVLRVERRATTAWRERVAGLDHEAAARAAALEDQGPLALHDTTFPPFTGFGS